MQITPFQSPLKGGKTELFFYIFEYRQRKKSLIQKIEYIENQKIGGCESQKNLSQPPFGLDKANET